MPFLSTLYSYSLFSLPAADPIGSPIYRAPDEWFGEGSGGE